MHCAVTVCLIKEARGGPFVFWYDLPAACRIAADLGFDAIELFLPSADAVDRGQLKSLLGDHNLKLAGLGTGGGWIKERLTLVLPDAKDRRRAQDFIRTIIDLGAEFGAPAVVGSMQGRSTDDMDPDTAKHYLAEALNTLGEYAAERGVPLLYEPLNRFETNLCNTIADALRLVDSL
jgi:sugar phosphate isomerase/epimerase